MKKRTDLQLEGGRAEKVGSVLDIPELFTSRGSGEIGGSMTS